MITDLFGVAISKGDWVYNFRRSGDSHCPVFFRVGGFMNKWVILVDKILKVSYYCTSNGVIDGIETEVGEADAEFDPEFCIRIGPDEHVQELISKYKEKYL